MKAKYERWKTKEGQTLLRGWARDGLTDEQIAKNMGVNVATLYRWKNEHCEICEAIKKGKDVADYEVENALYREALRGNITAIIFWLKNRRPDKWRDKVAYVDETELNKLDELIDSIDKAVQ